MLLGFKKRFIEPIQKGTKVFTMREKRKIKPKIGETLYMYSGLRTSKCVKISDKERLMSTQRVRVWIKTTPGVIEFVSLKIWVDGRRLSLPELREFVKFDGFKDVYDFVNYWVTSSIGRKPNPSKGYKVGGFLTLYHWTDLRY